MRQKWAIWIFIVYIVYHKILGLGLKIICFCNLEQLITGHKLNVL